MIHNISRFLILNFFSVFLFLSFASAQIEGYWRLDETASGTCGGGEDSCDETANNNHGNWNGTVAGSTDINNKVGTFGSVDLGSGYIDYGDQANHEQNSITISIWAKPDATGSSGGYLAQLQDDAGNKAGYGLYQTGGTVHFKIANAAGTLLDLTASVPDTEWHHWAGTYDSATGNAVLYLDGESVDTDTFGAAANLGYTFTHAASDNLYVGRFVDSDEDFQFSGLLDEARVYSTVLTQTEVEDLAGASIGSEIGTLDTKHYIPPSFVSSGSADPGDIDNHYLWVSTDSSTAIEVTLNDGASIKTATPLGVLCVRDDNPVLINLSGGAHTLPLVDPVNCPNKSDPAALCNNDVATCNATNGSGFGSKGFVDNAGGVSVNSTVTTEGLILESNSADNRFYANIRHSSNSQGASLTAKGHTALGQRFRSGHVLTNSTHSQSKKAHFISVMALTDDTRVTFSDATDINFVGLAADTVPGPFDLDQYESVVVAVQMDGIDGGEDPDALNGTLITTSDALGGVATKLAVVNSGSFLAGQRASGRDIGFDQILPVDYLGTQFVMAKGAGDTNEYLHQRPIVVADSDNTKIFINGSLTELAEIDAGEFFEIPGCTSDPGDGNPCTPASTSNFPNDVMFIETSQPAAVYQNLMANETNNGQGLNYIPAVFPNLETQDVVIADANQLGNASIDVIITAGASFTVTGAGCSTGATNPVSGTTLFEIAKVTGCTADVTVTSPQPFFTSLSVESGARGAAGFFTGFPNSYAIRDDVTTGKNAAKTIDVLNNDIKGFFDFFTDSATTPINGGSVVINGDNTITYTPPNDFVGVDVFEYTIEDNISGFQDTTIVTVTVIEAPGAVADDLQVWLKADGNVGLSGSDVTAWNNEVPNANVPNVTPSGTNPEFISSDTNFNFNPTIDFQNESLTRSSLDETDLVDTTEGTMFVVSTNDDSSLTISSTTAGGTCGANRCSTGFRSAGGQFSAGETTYGGAVAAGKANILGLRADSTAPGNIVSVNGLNSSSTNANAFDNTLQYQIAVGEYNGTTITGRIAEAITYSRNLTPDEFGQVETYLGIKYGVTLDQTTGRDYIDSNGNVVFDAEAGDDFDSYDNDIAGIALDDGSLLDQRKSKSVNTGSIVTIAHGSLSTPTVLDDTLDYLVWGHDGTASTNVVRETIGATVYERLQRVYRVKNNGSVAGAAIEFDLTGLGLVKQNTQVALLIDNDLTFSNATLHTTGRVVLGDVVSFTGVNFSDRDYFTLVLQEEPEVNWSSASQNQNENAGNMTFSASLDFASNLAVSIPYTLGGTATSGGTDYSITASPASISAGSTSSGTITVTVTGESVVEADETVEVTMGAVTNAKKGSTDVHTATINNDDTTTVTLAQNVGTVNEGGNLTYTATLSNPVQGGFDLSFTTSDGTATTADSDYTDNDSSVTFAGTAAEVENITVVTTTDSKVELDETISVALGTVSSLGAGIDSADITLAGSPQSGTITNNDQATVTITGDTDNEGNTLGFTVSIDNPVDVAVSMTSNTSDGTATTADSDYTAVSGGTVTFSAGSTANQTENVSTTVDNKVEANETLTLTLSSLSASGRNVIFSGAGATLAASGTISNDDQATITIANDNDDEGNTLGFVVSLSNPVDVAVSMTTDTGDGTATTADSDYTAVSGGTVTFPAGSTADQTENVSTTTDNKVEADETLTLTLSALSASGRNVIFSGGGGTLGATGTIDNNDQATISIAGDTDDEGNTLGFTVSIDNPVDVAVNITSDTSDGTATTADSDYTAVSGGTVTFSAGSTADQTENVSTTTDNKVEADETLTLTLSAISASGRDVVFSGGGGTLAATGTLTNEDTTTVTLAQNVGAVNEGGNLTYTATLSNPVQGGLDLSFTTNDGTATTADSDYTDNDGSLSFAGTASEVENITVVTTTDGKVELDETISVALGTVSGLGAGIDSADISLAGSPQSGTITNDDQAIVTIANDTENEGTNLGFVVSLSSPVDVAVSMTTDTSDGTATTADSDYTAVSGGTVTFSAGSTADQTETVATTTDSKVEADETLTLTLSALSASGRNVIFSGAGATLAATGTLTNEDTTTVTLAQNVGTVNEGGNLTYTATLTNPVQGGFDLNFTTNDGTATTADSDYTDNDSNVSFAGTASEVENITVVTTTDSDLESDETISVALTSVSGLGAGIDSGDFTLAGSPQSGTITNNDTATVSLSGTTDADETAPTNGVFTATLSKQNKTGATITVEFDDAGTGSATSGSDYTAIAGAAQISILDGQTSGTITVVVTDDPDLEPTEDIDATISAPSNADVTVATANASINVLDDDGAGDDDGDGIINSEECPTPGSCPDSDGDGTPDYQDDDSDNDGENDIVECTTGIVATCEDADGDGIPDYLEPDNVDTDGDGINNDQDGDDDNNVDTVEDADGDDTSDECSAPNNPFNCPDTDGDGIPDYLDIDDSGAGGDSDGDGIPDTEECPSGILCPDSDGDGVPDYNDTDSDNDGENDNVECTTGVVATCEDADGDGIPDYLEPDNVDTDGDGVNNDQDGDDDNNADTVENADGDDTSDECSAPNNPFNCPDTDGDGIPDYLDLADAGVNAGDSDGDGILDDIECPNGILCPDTDGDGLPDYMDPDSDGDGIPDATECTIPANCEDADADGIPDYQEPNVDTDNDGNNDGNDTDADGDGIDDSEEYDTDGDGDGADDTDGDGIPDFLDGDSDGDGVTDADELAADAADCNPDPTVPACAVYNSAEVTGVPTTADSSGDSDGDGIPDDVECPAGLLCPDSDGDGLADYFDPDSDNDGIPDATECTTPANCEDADADGIPDYQEPNIDTDGDGNNDGNDTDADNDGIDDSVEYDTDGDGDGADDTDGDGIPDFLDGDSDGDGVTDADELAADAADCNPDPTVPACAVYNSAEVAGVPTTADTSGDSDGDGIPDATECPNGILCPDTDGDNIPDYFDPDSDNDGIPDATECTIPAACEDADADGIPDYQEPNIDTDDDGNNDGNDNDADGDGIDDSEEYDTDGDGDGADDTDGDGIPDFLDGDSDGDGVTDADELAADAADCFPSPIVPACAVYNSGETTGTPTTADSSGDSDGDGIPDDVECPNGLLCPDFDGDGLPDYFDPDSDDDGIPDSTEAGADPSNPVDTDGNGDPDYTDTDSDDDGIDDNTEGIVDGDMDGKDDYVDDDSDNDGIPDSTETDVDTDGDGANDNRDPDSDNDSIPDSVELAVDVDGDGFLNFRDLDSDGDGIMDIDEAIASVGVTARSTISTLDNNDDGQVDNLADQATVPNPVDTDNDGVVDVNDVDSDGDGILDSVEAQTTTATRSATGVDTDGDGIDDAFDVNHQGAVVLVDTDGDGFPDFRDFDSDGDGISDRDEAFDIDGDGVADTTPLGVDADGDGLDDAFDPDFGFVAPVLPDTDGNGVPDFRQPNSVQGCDVNDQTEAQLAIDGSALRMLEFVRQAKGLNRRIAARDADCSGLNRSRSNKIQNIAHNIYDELWSLTWITVQSQEYDCDDLPPVCSELDLTDTISEMKKKAKSLERQIKKALGAQCVKESRRGRGLVKRAKRQRKAINQRINTIPNPFLACDP